MSYVIYDKETTRVPAFAWYVGIKYYKTAGAAKSALTRAFNKGRIEDKDAYDIAEAHQFHTFIEKTRKVKNLMSGREVEEAVNTPNCCSVGSETYWSM